MDASRAVVKMFRQASRRGWVVTTVALPLVVILAPRLGLGLTAQRTVELTILLSLVVSGLNLCYGYAGELALGQVAAYAAGAYVAGYLSIHVTSDLLVCVLAAAVAGPVIGLITGVPGLRLAGWSLAMVSFFTVLLIPDMVAILSTYTGGAAGLNGINSATLFGHPLDGQGLYLFMAIAAAFWFAAMRNIVTSRRGRALLVMRESTVLAAAVGLPVFRSKLTAYVLGAVPAGMAGAMLAYLDQFLVPQQFDFSLAIAVLAATVLGGRTSVYGAVIGAAILELGPLRAGSFENYATIIYGLFLLLGGVLLAGGIVGLVRRGVRRLVPPEPLPEGDEDADGAPLVLRGKTLTVNDVTKTFGGATALDGVNLTARPGQVTSIIGPNGSGKTTLLNLVNGYGRPTGGTIALDGVSLDRPAWQVARLGVTRTFQTPIVSDDISVIDTVAAARVSLHRTSLLSVILRLPRFRRLRAEDGASARRALRRVGLGEHAAKPGTSLSLGSRRLLEVARVLCADPAVILLDEVASGVDEDAVANLARLVRTLADAGATVVLVEHNFRLVLEVSDEIYVLAEGSVITSGTPEEIANHPDVLEKYLGTPVANGRSQ
jgi:branched-chain amino acid transport system permease protein